MSNCPSCAADLFQLVDLGKYHQNVPAYHLCVKCGLVQHRQLRPFTEMSAYYETDYANDYIEAEFAQAKTYAPYLDRLEKEGWLLAGSRVLDIGCANGDFLRLLKARGYACSGLEPSLQMAEHTRKSGLDVVCANLEDFSGEQKYDCIFMNHVLEHFVDPLRALLKARDLLNQDGGRVMLRVPTFASPQPISPFKYIHPFVFSETSLKNLAILSGYAIIDIKHIDSDIYAVLKVDPSSIYNGIFCDLALEFEKVQAFIARREQMLYSIYSNIARFKKDTKLIIYGAGSVAYFLLREMQLADCDILTIVDSDKKKHGHIFWKEITIMPPQFISELEYDFIVVASYAFTNEICTILEQFGVESEKIFTINKFA